VAESSSGTQVKKRRRIKVRYIVLIAVVALLIAGAFELKILRLPQCHPAIQEEVDWPPDSPGFYEEASHNRLRTLEQGGFSPPGTVSVCNVPGAPASQVVARVPADARFVAYEAGQQSWDYYLYHSVDVPPTGECVRVRTANRVEGLVVEPDPSNADMVWIRPPAPLEPEQTYMITFGSDVTRGVIVTTTGTPGS
jgi:hypothetical protein